MAKADKKGGKKAETAIVVDDHWDGSSLIVPSSLLISMVANGANLLAAASGEVHLVSALIRFLATEAIALAGVSLLWWLYSTMGAPADAAATHLDDEVVASAAGASATLAMSDADATPRRRRTDDADEQVGAGR